MYSTCITTVYVLVMQFQYTDDIQQKLSQIYQKTLPQHAFQTPADKNMFLKGFCNQQVFERHVVEAVSCDIFVFYGCLRMTTAFFS